MAKHSASPPRPNPTGTHVPDTGEAGHRRGTEDQGRARTLKGRITEDLDRVDRNRRPRRRDRIGQGSESLKQAVEKTKDAFGRDGSGTR